ncbi:MAG: thioredoxin family protein [Planctomycetota bacterium]|jgi:thioredoxin 1
MAEIVRINDESFEDEILKSQIPAAVLFKGAGCPHCTKMMSIVEELADRYRGRIKMAVLDVGDGPNTAIEHAVLSVPQLLLFKAGQKVDEMLGAVPEAQAVEKVEGLLR